MKQKWLLLGALTLCLASCQRQESNVPEQTPPPSVKAIETTHYLIYSTALPAQTKAVSEAVEALYSAYSQDFPVAKGSKLELVLYANQEEFKQHNKSSPWAEAYYSFPRCYAYPGRGANPFHWMTHEATHQLIRQASGLHPEKWINEGLASYYGSSQIRNGRLIPGLPDKNAYPIWWLDSLHLSGDMKRDISSGKIISLRDLITNSGPNINDYVNEYYIGYWSLTHFLLNFHDGIYAEKYKTLIRLGGKIEDFDRLIGPADKIQEEWYQYLMARSNESSTVTVTAVTPN